MKKKLFFGLLATVAFYAYLCPAGEVMDKRMQEGQTLYLQAQQEKAKNNQAKYYSLVKRAAAAGWIPAVFEDAEAELNSTRKTRIVNAEDIVRSLEKIIKNSKDPQQQARARYLLGLSHEKGIYTFADRKEALKNYLLGSRLDIDARIAAIRLMNSFSADTKFGKEWDAAAIVLYAIWCQAPDQDKRIGSIPSMIPSYEKTLTGIAQAGDTQAMYYLATHYLEGTFFPLRKTKGMEYLKSSAAAGNPNAQLLLGEILEQGLYNQKIDTSEAIENFKKAFLYGPTSATAAEHLVKLMNSEKDTPMKVRYLIALKRYPDAMELVKKTQKDDFSPMLLYLQAKLYEQTTKDAGKFDKDEYARLLDMAVNAGSFPAKEERTALSQHTAEELYEAKTLNRQVDDPEWLYQTALLAIRSAKTGKAKPKEALRFLNFAAKAGNLNAMFLLASAYEKGAPVLEIKPNPAKAKEYQDMMMKRDFTYSWTSMLVPALERQKDNMLAIRAAAYNPVAAANLAKNISGTKTQAASVLLNSLAAGANTCLTVEEYEKQVQNFVSGLK